MNKSDSILLVEDDHIDILAVKRALKEIEATNPLSVVNNGEEALDFLRNKSNEKPAIVLLDLNMPKMNGIEFLRVVKQDCELKSIPVVVLTTSREEQDRIDSFSLSVAGYMVKPISYVQFAEVLKTIHGYWMLSEVPT